MPTHPRSYPNSFQRRGQHSFPPRPPPRIIRYRNQKTNRRRRSRRLHFPTITRPRMPLTTATTTTPFHNRLAQSFSAHHIAPATKSQSRRVYRYEDSPPIGDSIDSRRIRRGGSPVYPGMGPPARRPRHPNGGRSRSNPRHSLRTRSAGRLDFRHRRLQPEGLLPHPHRGPRLPSEIR